jgi:hypothetical protein
MVQMQRATGSLEFQAPIAASGDNVYITWWINKTGNNEVMLKESHAGGKTFSDKMNLSIQKESSSVT